MKLYFISLGVGILVGAFYGLLQVRSPAPPLVALIGLLGMLAGEQIASFVNVTLTGNQATSVTISSSTSAETADGKAVSRTPENS